MTSAVPQVEPLAAPAPETPSGPGHQESKKLRRAIIGVVAGAVVLVAVVYVAGVAVFSQVLLPNTTIDGRDVSLKLASEESSAYAAKVNSYQVHVTCAGLDFTVRGSDIDLAFDEARYREGILGQQDARLWPAEVFGTHELTATSGVTFDEDKLRQIVTDKVNEFNKTATAPTDASIGYDEGQQAFAVVAETYGTTIDADALATQIKDAIGALPGSIAGTEAALAKPALTKDSPELVQAVDNATRYLSANIPLTMGGKAAGQISKDQISGWIVLADDRSASIDKAKVEQWARNEIGAKFDTVRAKRTYTRADGKQVTVNDSGYGNYGWVTDEASLVEKVVSAIEAGSTDTIEIPVKQSAQAVPDAGGKDWGNRYIDIDLTEQHVRMYDDSGSLVWESDCVTGDHAKAYDTPEGVFQLNNNRSSGDVELRGKIDPSTGEPEYISRVDYWMPFIGNSWALHDADWRSKFGGTIYESNGSHGCVNLPPEKAADLYKLCKVGDVVIVHY